MAKRMATRDPAETLKPGSAEPSDQDWVERELWHATALGSSTMLQDAPRRPLPGYHSISSARQKRPYARISMTRILALQ